MKALLIAAMSLGLAASAQAKEINVYAVPAYKLFNVLQASGAIECHGGNCAMQTSNVVCETVLSHYSNVSCKADLPTAMGSRESKPLSAELSAQLADALTGAGVREVCLPGHCEIEVQAVTCGSSDGNSELSQSTTCRISE